MRIRTHVPKQLRMFHACIHMLGFQKLWKVSFSALKLRFGMTLTSTGSRCKPIFSHYIKPYIVPFQNTWKILRENTRFTRNSESKRKFFTKHPQVNIFLIETFSGLDLGVYHILKSTFKNTFLRKKKSFWKHFEEHFIKKTLKTFFLWKFRISSQKKVFV